MPEEYGDRPERALRDALSHRAEEFEPVALDPTAPRRRTPWRAWRTWGAAAAAAVLVAGTAGGVAWWQGDDRPGIGIDPTVEGQLAPPDAGWRYESFLDVVVQVPDTWGYGSAPRSDWCVSASEGQGPYPTEPYVAINGAGGAVLDIGCPNMDDPDPLGMEAPERLWTTHLSLGSPMDHSVPDGTTELHGWTRIIATVGHARFTILADQAHLADAGRIVDSARIVTTDHHGCDATSPIQDGLFPRPPHPFDLASIGSVDEIAVCQYAFHGPEGEPALVASRLLSGPDANAELGALQGTTIGSGPNTPDTCSPDSGPDTAVVLRINPFAEPHDIYVYYDSCVHNGFDDGTNVRQLRRENCVPLWGERVIYWGGSSAPFQRCHDSDR